MKLSLFNAILCCSLTAHGVSAETFDFVIANTSLEQIVSSQQQIASLDGIVAPTAIAVTNTSVIAQDGLLNSAVNLVTGSSGSVAAMLQSGAANAASTAIIGSPQSQIAGVQIGTGNDLTLAIVGGSGNVVAAAQIGTDNALGIALINSTGTTITYGQLGQGANGSVTFINGAPGTQIRIGGDTTQ